MAVVDTYNSILFNFGTGWREPITGSGTLVDDDPPKCIERHVLLHHEIDGWLTEEQILETGEIHTAPADPA